MTVRRIDARGNGLMVSYTDGTRAMALPIAGSAWIIGGQGTPGPGPGPDPDPTTFDMVSNDGALSFTIQSQGMQYARTIFDAGVNVGLPRDGIVCAFMCVMTEAPPFLMYANSNVPESLDYPHDAVGSDNDSLGLFQQRPAAGWGTVAELMDANYNARAFYGGASGPNNGSPAGLLDISPAWDERATLGTAVQAVQVSAFPDRYDNWTDACYALHDALAGSAPSGDWTWSFVPSPYTEGGDMPATGSADADAAEWGVRSGFSQPFHEGIDFGYGNATSGAPVLAASDGTVAFAGFTSAAGNWTAINHPDGTSTNYFHQDTVSVTQGDTVSVGQTIGTVGNTGGSFGAHLHFECHAVPYAEQVSDRAATSEGAYGGTSRDPRTFMSDRGAVLP